MKDFILGYYKELIVLGCFFLEFLLSLVALIKKQKKQSPLILDIISSLPKFISSAEKYIGSGNGSKKKDFVLQCIAGEFKRLTGEDIDAHTLEVASIFIEEILKTPQKKGNLND